jgi:hypothetical protein
MVAALSASAAYDVLVGTKLVFENSFCRMVELKLAPGSGQPSQYHQHALDYGMVWVQPTCQDVFVPSIDGAKYIATAVFADGNFMYKTVACGGRDDSYVKFTLYEDDKQPQHFYHCTDGEPIPGWAVHNVTNARSDEWLRNFPC